MLAAPRNEPSRQLTEVSVFKMLLGQLAAPNRRLHEATCRERERLNSHPALVAETRTPPYGARNSRSSGVIGWLMTLSGISQMISRGGLSRNVAPAK